jgi:hypothetical protein
MKTIIAGSRDIQNYRLVEEAVRRSGYIITTVISGGARGVDRLGLAYARQRRIPFQVFMPEWERLGKGAGMVRNREMANVADALIAVWDGKSKGTRNMIELASARRLPCFVLLVNGGVPAQIPGVIFSTHRTQQTTA